MDTERSAADKDRQGKEGLKARVGLNFRGNPAEEVYVRIITHHPLASWGSYRAEGCRVGGADGREKGRKSLGQKLAIAGSHQLRNVG